MKYGDNPSTVDIVGMYCPKWAYVRLGERVRSSKSTLPNEGWMAEESLVHGVETKSVGFAPILRSYSWAAMTSFTWASQNCSLRKTWPISTTMKGFSSLQPPCAHRINPPFMPLWITTPCKLSRPAKANQLCYRSPIATHGISKRRPPRPGSADRSFHMHIPL